jgi:hypothetical protein
MEDNELRREEWNLETEMTCGERGNKEVMSCILICSSSSLQWIAEREREREGHIFDRERRHMSST